MTVEPGHEPFDRERASRPTSHPTAAGQTAHFSAVRHGTHVEESPELLRWRADLLMDEMMMGGVDVSAADGNRTFSGVDAPVVQRPQTPAQPLHNGNTNNGTTNGNANPAHRPNYHAPAPSGYDPNGYESNGHAPSGYEPSSHEPSSYENGGYANGHFASGLQNGDSHTDTYQGGTYQGGDSRIDHGRTPGSDYQGDLANGAYSPGNYQADYRNGSADHYAGAAPESSYDGAPTDDDLRRGYPSPAANHPATPEPPRENSSYGERFNVPPRTQPAPNRYEAPGYDRTGYDPRNSEPSGYEPSGYAPSGYAPNGIEQRGDQRGHEQSHEVARPDVGHGYDSGFDSSFDSGYVERTAGNGYPDVPQARGITAPRQYPDPTSEQPPQQYQQQYQQPYQSQPAAAPYPEPTRPQPDRQPDPRQDAADNPSSDPAADYPSALRTNVDNLPGYGRHEGAQEQPPRTDRLYSVEQQYEQFRREQSATIQPVEPPRAEPRAENMPPRQATRPPLPPVEPPRYPTTPPRVTPPPVDEHTQWATGPDKWEYQDFSANPHEAQEAEEDLLLGGQPLIERRYADDSVVRHDPAQYVSAMSVMNNGKKRSTLLPRSTELDIDTLHREISDLHGEIAALLPVGNETSERARHLLDKAYSILQSDPSRSAEVEYYMQQVRTIVQRLRQSRQWSDLYRHRLHVYLLGWLGLSAMVLFARFFFQMDLEDMLVWVTGAGWDSWLVAHWAAFVGTAAAGAFGGALGALYTMRAHARGEHSFFDRKYGLRGLILPFMGLIVGMVGYVIFGLLFALVGINPASNLTAAVIPTTAAFAFGFNQESIYGTRG